jgi:hypothetical protein
VCAPQSFLCYSGIFLDIELLQICPRLLDQRYFLTDSEYDAVRRENLGVYRRIIHYKTYMSRFSWSGLTSICRSFIDSSRAQSFYKLFRGNRNSLLLISRCRYDLVIGRLHVMPHRHTYTYRHVYKNTKEEFRDSLRVAKIVAAWCLKSNMVVNT